MQHSPPRTTSHSLQPKATHGPDPRLNVFYLKGTLLESGSSVAVKPLFASQPPQGRFLMKVACQIGINKALRTGSVLIFTAVRRGVWSCCDFSSLPVGKIKKNSIKMFMPETN